MPDLRRSLSYYSMQTINLIRCAAICAASVGLLFSTSPLFSQSAPAGSLGGRVQNSAAGNYLNNARVTIEGTNVSTLTNEFGEYFFPNIPPGETRLTAFYSGLPAQTLAVNITAGQRAVQDFDLMTTGPIKLDTFTISASREMSQADVATNEQRFAPNMKTVLAADTFGDQTENNVAEFLKLMPAISVAYLEDHANSVSIRGMPSATTIVTSNGNQLASNTNSGGNSRAFEFEQLSINDVARIEINKSLLPDMPAEGIGGTINLITKSAFERSRPELRYRSYLNFNSTLVTFKKTPGPGRDPTYKIQPAFDFTYTNPLRKNFGITVGAAYIQKYVPMYIAGTTWTLNPDPVTGVENPFVASITTQDTPKQIQRTSGRISADWRFARNDVLSVGFSEAYYKEQGMNHRFDVSMGTNPVSVSPAFAQGRPNAGSVTNRGSQTIKSGTTWTPDFKWTHNGPLWKFEAAGAYSHASIVRRAHEKGFISNGTFNVGTINASGTGLVGPTIRFDKPATICRRSRLSWQRVSLSMSGHCVIHISQPGPSMQAYNPLTSKRLSASLDNAWSIWLCPLRSKLAGMSGNRYAIDGPYRPALHFLDRMELPPPPTMPPACMILSMSATRASSLRSAIPCSNGGTNTEFGKRRSSIRSGLVRMLWRIGTAV
jgi:hypothetical protein